MSSDTSMVSSAADCCGKPRPIRSVGNSCGSCRIAKAAGVPTVLGALALLGMTAGPASAGVIYRDSFTGSSALGTLNGAAPTVGPAGATWTASSSTTIGWADSGYSDSGYPNQAPSAYLPFTPAGGQIYTLTASLDVLASTDSGFPQDYSNMNLGFVTAPSVSGSTNNYNNHGASPWLQSDLAGTGGTFFTGPGVVGGQNFSNTSGVNTYSIVLNTGSSAWTYQVFQSNSSVTNKLVGSGAFTSTTDPAIVAVGLQNSLAMGQVSNFELTSSPVPEPATLGLFAVGGIALLLLGRKRAVS